MEFLRNKVIHLQEQYDSLDRRVDDLFHNSNVAHGDLHALIAKVRLVELDIRELSPCTALPSMALNPNDVRLTKEGG